LGCCADAGPAIPINPANRGSRPIQARQIVLMRLLLYLPLIGDGILFRAGPVDNDIYVRSAWLSGGDL
jgi:hypothetical protein